MNRIPMVAGDISNSPPSAHGSPLLLTGNCPPRGRRLCDLDDSWGSTKHLLLPETWGSNFEEGLARIEHRQFQRSSRSLALPACAEDLAKPFVGEGLAQ